MSLSNALSLYNTSTQNQAGTTGNQTASATATVQASASTKSGTTASGSIATPTKLVIARQQLNLQQQSLAKEIRSALTKAGQSLSGTVDFSLTSDGKLSVSGSDADKAKINALLAADKSVPSVSTRLTNLNKQAQAFDKQSVQTNVAMVAARQAGKGTQNLVALYQSMMANQSTSQSVFLRVGQDQPGGVQRGRRDQGLSPGGRVIPATCGQPCWQDLSKASRPCGSTWNAAK
ncbi:MAG: hypothetical protein QM749_20195 [Aquabacterium sp.]